MSARPSVLGKGLGFRRCKRRQPLLRCQEATLVALLAAAWLAIGVGWSRADNWPYWRGPERNGICLEKNVPTRWSHTENIVWRLPLPGPAGATPVVWNDRIFLTSADDRDLVLLCVSTQGKLLWSRKLGEGNRVVRGGEGNSASASPSTDGKYVWAFIGTGILGCFDFDGKEIWKLDLQDRYGRFQIQFGMTSTPLLEGNVLYLQLIHSGGAHVIALDKMTGQEIWKHDRPSDATAECEHSYASPILYRDAERAFLVSHGADYVIGHRLNDGSEIWRCGGLNPKERYNPTLRFVASPVAVPGLIVVPSAKNGPVVGIAPTAEGNITESRQGVRWFRPQNTPDVPSPLVHDGLVYLCRETGVLICLDASTGEELYQQRVHSQRHRASPIYADGHIYMAGVDGEVNVIRAGKTYELVSKNRVGETLTASPVVSNGRLYLRTYESLFAIE